MNTQLHPVTKGPAFHWFGYYDKLQFSPDSRFVLCMETDFENRTPKTADTVRIGMVDLESGNEWIPLAHTGAFCWQQGCMLQWIPGREDEIIYNDREGDGFVSCILNVKTRETKKLPAPVYTLSPDGKTALGLDFHRTGRLRPGYGYAGTDRTEHTAAPDDIGIYRMDLQTGEKQLVISIARVASIKTEHYKDPGLQHWVNHILFSPDGSRFIFLHRWEDSTGGAGQYTRMFTSDLNGENIRCMTDCGMSHFIWRDRDHIHGWARLNPDDSWKQYLFDEKTSQAATVGNPKQLTANGHMTYLPGGEWILNDITCERNEETHTNRLYLYHVPSDKRVELGDFVHENVYSRDFRCDLHPRSSRDGTVVCIDSACNEGRQMWVGEIGDLI